MYSNYKKQMLRLEKMGRLKTRKMTGSAGDVTQLDGLRRPVTQSRVSKWVTTRSLFHTLQGSETPIKCGSAGTFSASVALSSLRVSGGCKRVGVRRSGSGRGLIWLWGREEECNWLVFGKRGALEWIWGDFQAALSTCSRPSEWARSPAGRANQASEGSRAGHLGGGLTGRVNKHTAGEKSPPPFTPSPPPSLTPSPLSLSFSGFPWDEDPAAVSCSSALRLSLHGGGYGATAHFSSLRKDAFLSLFASFSFFVKPAFQNFFKRLNRKRTKNSRNDFLPSNWNIKKKKQKQKNAFVFCVFAFSSVFICKCKFFFVH